MKTLTFLFAFVLSFFAAKADSIQPEIIKARAAYVSLNSAEQHLLEELTATEEVNVESVLASLDTDITTVEVYNADGDLVMTLQEEEEEEAESTLPEGAQYVFSVDRVKVYQTK
jgi:hypothetical protein